MAPDLNSKITEARSSFSYPLKDGTVIACTLEISPQKNINKSTSCIKLTDTGPAPVFFLQGALSK